MAQLQLEPPGPFNFRRPDNWPRWKKWYLQLCSASGLVNTDGEQVNTLLYCLGKQTEAVLTSTNATEDKWKSFHAVIQKFDEFFKVRKNVIFEKARFNQHNEKGETAEEYIVELYRLSES